MLLVVFLDLYTMTLVKLPTAILQSHSLTVDANFLVQCQHMSFVDFVVLHPVHCKSVTDFRDWLPMRRS